MREEDKSEWEKYKEEKKKEEERQQKERLFEKYMSDAEKEIYRKKMENREKPSAKSSMTGLFVLIWFLGTIVYMIVLSTGSVANSQPKISIAFGQLFTGLGLIFLVDSIKRRIQGEKKNVSIGLPLLFVLIGLAAVAFGGIRIWGSVSAKSALDQVLPHLLCSCFILIGIYLLNKSFLKNKRMRSRCTVPVDVKCIFVKTRISRDSDGHSSRVYSPVWKGLFNGEERLFESEVSTSKWYREGQGETILVNPDDPTEYIDSVQKSFNRSLLLFGIVFTIVGTVAEYLQLKF